MLNLAFLLIIVVVFTLLQSVEAGNPLEGLATKAACDYDHMVLERDELDTLNKLLHRFLAFAETSGLVHFAIAGTLIGAVRNGGLLPFDDDIDIGIIEPDKIKTFQDDDGFYFDEVFFGYKFKMRGKDTFIDIMVFESTEDGEYKIKDNHWPNEYFKKNELFPLQKMSFSDNFTLNIPSKPIDYLHRVFPDWDTTIKMECGHYDSKECVYDKHDIPKEFSVNFENSKYLCYSKF
jgi:phosphorylcholine metabolism protein LicD